MEQLARRSLDFLSNTSTPHRDVQPQVTKASLHSLFGIHTRRGSTGQCIAKSGLPLSARHKVLSPQALPAGASHKVQVR